jgi:hypothetical protein
MGRGLINLSATSFRPLFAAFLSSCLFSFILAQPATLHPEDCFTGNDTQKFNISTVYAQILDNNSLGTYLNLTLFGQSNLEILGTANGSNNLCEISSIRVAKCPPT